MREKSHAEHMKELDRKIVSVKTSFDRAIEQYTDKSDIQLLAGALVFLVGLTGICLSTLE